MCPYEVPQFNKSLGIVRKCDMYSDRLAVGQAPACIQSCHTDAIRIAVVDTETVKSNADTYVANIADTSESTHTYPTTVFKSERNVMD